MLLKMDKNDIFKYSFGVISVMAVKSLKIQILPQLRPFARELAALEAKIAQKEGSDTKPALSQAIGMSEGEIDKMAAIFGDDQKVVAIMKRSARFAESSECHEIISRLLMGKDREARFDALVEIVRWQLNDSGFNIRLTVDLLIDLQYALSVLEEELENHTTITVNTYPKDQKTLVRSQLPQFTYVSSQLPLIEEAEQIVMQFLGAFSALWKEIQHQIGDKRLLGAIFTSELPDAVDKS